jgi:hypothetical protein
LTVTHFFNVVNCFAGPAGTRWAALLSGANFNAANFDT